MKKRNKVNAEFNMSSLTDIIFLLLIFFMLTSSLVQINVELPKSDSKTVAPTNMAVMLTKDGRMTFNGKKATYNQLSGLIRNMKESLPNEEANTVTIIAEVDVPWERISRVMEITSKQKVRAIIATEPRKQ